MLKRISESANKEAISRGAIRVFCRQAGRRWGANHMADHEVLTLIEAYFEAWAKVGRGRTVKRS